MSKSRSDEVQADARVTEASPALEAADTRPGGIFPKLSEPLTVELPSTEAPLPGDAPGACLVEIHGTQVGRRLELDRARFAVGRVAPSDILVESPSVSRSHAVLERGPDGYEVIDNDSTNGTWVNDERVTRRSLRDGDIVVFGGIAFRFIASPNLNQAVSRVLEQIALTDGLTQTATRTALEDALCAHRDESGAVLGFAITDFTRLSARHGGLAAERVVALLAGILRQRVRRSDVVARVGASAFAVLVPGLDESSARRKGEQLRRHVEQSTFKYNDSVLPIALEVVVEAGRLGSTAILKDALARLHVGPEAT